MRTEQPIKAGERTQSLDPETFDRENIEAEREFSESSERLDYATHVRESGDWRDVGEIRMGA